MLEVIGSYHHGGRAQGVAGTSEVMPLDAVKLSDVVSDGVVDTVQVGETTSVKPPACQREGRRSSKEDKWRWREGDGGMRERT